MGKQARGVEVGGCVWREKIEGKRKRRKGTLSAIVSLLGVEVEDKTTHEMKHPFRISGF